MYFYKNLLLFLNKSPKYVFVLIEKIFHIVEVIDQRKESTQHGFFASFKKKETNIELDSWQCQCGQESILESSVAPHYCVMT